MDAFKINWNQKMKDDMFVNKVINGDTSKDRFTFYEVNNAGQNRSYQFLMSNPLLDYKDVFKYFAERNVTNVVFEDNRRLFDNTGPRSLYNLHYASIR